MRANEYNIFKKRKKKDRFEPLYCSFNDINIEFHISLKKFQQAWQKKRVFLLYPPPSTILHNGKGGGEETTWSERE